MRRPHCRLNEVESDADDSKVAHEVDQMKVKIASTSLGQCLEGILTNADVKGVTVELLNKETFILHEEVAIGTDFIMGRRTEDHKTRIIPFSAVGTLRLD